MLCSNRKRSHMLVAEYLIVLTALQFCFFSRVRFGLDKLPWEGLCIAGLSVFWRESQYLVPSHTNSSTMWFPLPSTDSTEIQRDRDWKRKKKEARLRGERREEGLHRQLLFVSLCLLVWIKDWGHVLLKYDQMTSQLRRVGKKRKD